MWTAGSRSRMSLDTVTRSACRCRSASRAPSSSPPRTPWARSWRAGPAPTARSSRPSRPAAGACRSGSSRTPWSARPPPARSSAASSGPVAPNANGAIRTSCGSSDVAPSRVSGTRWSPSIRPRSPGSCRPGTASRPWARRRRHSEGPPPWSASPRSSISWRACRCRPPCSNATSCPRGSPGISRDSWTSWGRWARSPGSAMDRSVATMAASRSFGPVARSSGPSDPSMASNDRANPATRPSASTWPGGAPRSTGSCSRRPAAGSIATSSTLCGISSGPARSPTTRSRRCGPCAGSAPAAEATGGRASVA